MRLPSVTAVFLTGALVAGAALAQVGKGPPKEAVRHYTEGMRHLERGELEAAEAELEAAVRLDPDYLDALGSLARVYLKRGKRTHFRAMLKHAAEVKAAQAGVKRPPEPRLAPLSPPSSPPPPKTPEKALAKRPDRNRWRHEGPEPKGVFVTERESRRDRLGNLRIEGTVKNNTSRTVRRVVIALVAFNADGRSLDPPLTYRGPWELEPGLKAPFRLNVSDAEDRVERFDLKASWEPVEE